MYSCFFFFNDTATTEIYTLSLHDALPICLGFDARGMFVSQQRLALALHLFTLADIANIALKNLMAVFEVPVRDKLKDRKSTRLNSSHLVISYAVFCLKKKNIHNYTPHRHD